MAPYHISTFLTNHAYTDNYNISRFISGQKYFFHVTVNNNSQLGIIKYTVNDGFEMKKEEYFLYENYHKNMSWFLSPHSNLENATIIIQETHSIIAKNGFISDNQLYLTRFSKIEVYKWIELKSGLIELVFERTMDSHELVYCRFDNSDANTLLQCSYLLLIFVFIFSLIDVISNQREQGYRFIMINDSTLVELKDQIYYK